MTAIGSIVLYTASLLITALIFMIWLRIFLRFLNVSSLHPASVSVNHWTNFLISPVATLIGSAGTLTKRYDVPSFIVLFAVEFVKFIVLGLLQYGGLISLKALFIMIIADLILQPLNLIFYAVLIRSVMSWFVPTFHSPITEILKLLTEPLFLKAREYIPPAGGIDFSPVMILIGLKAFIILLTSLVPVPML